MERVILIDGNSLLFRAYFAMRPMVTSSGIHTQGIFAFINMLNKIINDYSPDYIAVAFDMKEKTFRHDIYSEYKAGRLQTPIELLAEIPLTHKVLEAMNIKILEMPKFEADDLIGTAAKRASKAGFETIVISGDKDELQLVDENTKVLINKKGMSEFDLYDVDAMKARYNLTPVQFIDLKGLMGDKSDNIPGIPGVGEKKGIALLEQYGSVEGVLEHSDEIPGKLGETVRDNKEQAELSKYLATINTEAPIDFEWKELKYEEPDYKALVDVYTELEFSSFIKKLNLPEESMQTVAENNDCKIGVEEIKTISFSEFLNKTHEGENVVIELITDNSHIGTPELFKLALFSAEHNLFTSKEFTPMDLSVSVQNLSEKKYRLIGMGLKPIVYSLTANCDSKWNPYYDIAIAEYLLDANRSKYLLSKMLLRYNSITVDDSEAEIAGNLGPIELASIDDDFLKNRLYLINLVKALQENAIKDKGLEKLLYECEMPLVNTLASMELDGITVDVKILEDIGSEIEEKIKELELNIYKSAGREFNINSPKQLGVILFDELHIPYPKKGVTSYSTSAEILDKLKTEYDIVQLVLDYRKLAKLKSTYIDGLISLIGDDGKIHPHYQQTVAATGRLSCTEPNLQNIPIRDEYGRLIRKAFITSRDDYSFTGSDYSQIELRILAALSGDEVLINAFREGKDIHRATASSVFNIPFDQVSSSDRSKAKAVNFGVVYGMSGFGLSENLDISRSEAQKYINDYFEKHTAVKAYLDSNIEEGENKHEVRTHYGRVRQIPEFTSRKYMERELAKRLAMNTPIQGTAADIIKFAMNSVYNELQNRGLKSRLILQIHDELIIEGPDSEIEEVKKLLDSCMSGAADLAVELSCDIHCGKTWYELK